MTNTVKLKDYSKINLEFVAGEPTRSGMIIEVMENGKVRPHADANETALPYVALEDELQGKKIGDSYSADDPVQVWVPGRGCEAQLLLTDNQTIVVGDLLESAGNGKLQKHDSGTYGFGKEIVGQAMDAVNTTGSATEAWIKVRIY